MRVSCFRCTWDVGLLACASNRPHVHPSFIVPRATCRGRSWVSCVAFQRKGIIVAKSFKIFAQQPSLGKRGEHEIGGPRPLVRTLLSMALISRGRRLPMGFWMRKVEDVRGAQCPCRDKLIAFIRSSWTIVGVHWLSVAALAARMIHARRHRRRMLPG